MSSIKLTTWADRRPIIPATINKINSIQRKIDIPLFIPQFSSLLQIGNTIMASKIPTVKGMKNDLAKYKAVKIRKPKNSKAFAR
jgi:hypothetical protein